MTQVGHGIGSTFATELPSNTPGVIPWSGSGPVRYVQSGGQALRLIGETLWDDGRRTLLVPGFHCDSMIEPFSDRPWDVQHFPLTVDLRTTADAFAPWAEEPETTAILVAEYFGRTLDPVTTESLTRLQRAGVSIIEDRTHNLLDWQVPFADFVIGSLRKLLPVGDGAFVLGAAPEPGEAESNPGDDYWAAMDLKADGDPAARELFVRAEQRFASELRPGAASERTVDALQHLDFDGMAKTRRTNGRVLRDLLGGIDVLNGEDVIPSHLVVRVDDPVAVQQRMAAAGVFCPIHWPKPAGLSAGHSWPDDLLSLPLDHRYGASEMTVVARTLTDIVQT